MPKWVFVIVWQVMRAVRAWSSSNGQTNFSNSDNALCVCYRLNSIFSDKSNILHSVMGTCLNKSTMVKFVIFSGNIGVNSYLCFYWQVCVLGLILTLSKVVVWVSLGLLLCESVMLCLFLDRAEVLHFLISSSSITIKF